MNILGEIQDVVQFFKQNFDYKAAEHCIVLGSGLGAFASHLKIIKEFSFTDIPHFPKPTVVGHSGKVVFGEYQNKKVLVFQGRVHFYEGHSIQKVVLAVRAAKMWGCNKFLITNSAGGLLDGMIPGEFMVIDDHVNLSGQNPLIGPNINELGPRFPDMTSAYNKELTQHLELAIKKETDKYHKGIYVGLTGPTYETPSEVLYFKRQGFGAVGMSTVYETIALRHMGAQVAGLSCITNLGAGLSKHELSHDEVTDTTKKVEKQFIAILKNYLS